MGTRGLTGIRYKGIDKLWYNHYDSYPDGLGRKFIEDLGKTTIGRLQEVFDTVMVVSDEDTPSSEQVRECQEFLNLDVSEKSPFDWYCLLHDAQGNLDAYTNNGLRYMIVDNNFIQDSLFCEYGYIANLDNLEFEFWVGFQKHKSPGNRYGCAVVPSSYGTGSKYYPCKMVYSCALGDLMEYSAEHTPEFIDNIVKTLNSCNEVNHNIQKKR